MEMLFFTSKKLKLNIIRNLNKSEKWSEIGKQENNSRNQEKENNHNSCSKKKEKVKPVCLLKIHVSSVRDLKLNRIRPTLHSYRNQSIDLCCKSIDWFLYVPS